MGKTFLLELRDKAKNHPSASARKSLKLAADAIDMAMRAFTETPTHDTLRHLNGCWTAAWRLYEAIPDIDPDGAGGGKMRLEEKMAA